MKAKKVKTKHKVLKGIVHYCRKCKKRTEHRAEGEKWVRYAEICKICGQISYSEILRKDAVV
jgi:hypothetical protein